MLLRTRENVATILGEFRKFRRLFLATSASFQRQGPRSPGKLLLFAALASACTAFFLVPAIVIRPFSYQAPNSLMWAMKLRSYAPGWTLILCAASLFLCVVLWRQACRPMKALLALGMMLALFSTVMSRIDYFEWMFHPLPAPGFESAERVKLDPKQMVMAVRFGNDVRAYPIRAMAYHHIVNDVVAGTPIVVTY